MSIVRMGMAEDSNFGNGYDAIFGKKSAKPAAKKPAPATTTAAKKPAPATAAKKPASATTTATATKKPAPAAKKPAAKKK